jgi:hypothetical protein
MNSAYLRIKLEEFDYERVGISFTIASHIISATARLVLIAVSIGGQGG